VGDDEQVGAQQGHELDSEHSYERRSEEVQSSGVRKSDDLGVTFR